MRSALYEGTIRHRRFAVREREFRHRLALAYVDLDELPRLLGGRLVARRPGSCASAARDYLGDPAVPLADAVRALVAQRTGVRPGGPVRLLTQLRTLGHCFNPVSFYYCFAPGGERVEAVVAEVTNTPWGERHAYVLPSGGDGPRARRRRSTRRCTSRRSWAWTSATRGGRPRPGATLSVHIASTRATARRAFDATLSLRRRRSRAARSRGSPCATRRRRCASSALIYGHAPRSGCGASRVHPRPAADGR